MADDASDGEITLLLTQAQQGDASAAQSLLKHLVNDLRGAAQNMMLRERPDHTLQATALVNEACVRLIDGNVIQHASDRRYLFAAANRAMRQILVDHARKRGASKRGGDRQRESLDYVLDHFESANGVDFEQLDEALDTLENESPRQREVIEHRFFGGLSVNETAELLEVSIGTVERDWRLARAKLYALLTPEA